jgi:hypothetical protein
MRLHQHLHRHHHNRHRQVGEKRDFRNTRCTDFSFLDEPPPAYEVIPSSNNNNSSNGVEDVGAAAAIIEAPPPYCLVDPSKMRNTDHLPHYAHISPVEIIDLNAGTSSTNEHVSPIFLCIISQLSLSLLL